MSPLEGESLKAAALALLQSARLSEKEVSARLAEATSTSYWKALCPSASLLEMTSCDGIEAQPLADAVHAQVQDDLEQRGYFQVGPILSSRMVGVMRHCVEALRERAWPVVFSFVYDEFWAVTRTPSLVRLLGNALGSDFKQNSNMWTYWVTPVPGAAGWPPHMDSAAPGKRLTLWIPLTDATLENGCIYAIGRDKVPAGLPADYRHWSALSREEIDGLLQGIKAMPASAGSMLGWDHFAIHWGSRVGMAAGPRLSLSVEFVARDAPPRSDELPLLDAAGLPSFSERLHAIGKGLLEYQKFEPIVARFASLADRLMRF